jgi:Zn-dependent peptidase ImmA (M78 family)
MMNVPWLSKETISRKATELMVGFQALAKYEVKPPIPVEDIIERYLGLRLIYDDLTRVFGRDVLGAVYVQSKAICINERLFESSSEGRLVFTIAHEVGHWVLHRQYATEQSTAGTKNSEIVCRPRNAKEPIEWQADYFASCLLMPAKEIREAFEKVCASEPLVVKNSMSETGGGSGEEPYLEQWPFIAAAMCEAGGFPNVSKHAMIIRLQDLGLLVNKTKKKMDWNSIMGDE